MKPIEKNLGSVNPTTHPGPNYCIEWLRKYGALQWLPLLPDRLCLLNNFYTHRENIKINLLT